MLKNFIFVLWMPLLVSVTLSARNRGQVHQNQYSGSRVVRDTPVYRGASEQSQRWGEISADTELNLLSDRVYRGFYKVLYEGRVGYIPQRMIQNEDEFEDEEREDSDSGDEEREDEDHDHDGDDHSGRDGNDDEEDEETYATPTRRPTPRPTVRPTRRATARPTVRPTRRPTPRPTVRPTPRIITKEEAAARPGVKLSKKARKRLAKKRRAQNRRSYSSGSTTIIHHNETTYTNRNETAGSGYIDTGFSYSYERREVPLLYLYFGGARSKWARANAPFLPENEQDYNARSPHGSMFQFGMDYRANRFTRVFIDFSTYQYVRLVGRKDILSAGKWLKDAAPSTAPPGSQLGFLVNPLAEDMYMVMDTKGTRLGLKFGVPLGRFVELWIGGGLGIYEYNLNIGDIAAELSIGEGSGTVLGATWLAGVDFKIPVGVVYLTLTPFIEGASPKPVIETNIDLGTKGIRQWKARNDLMAPIRAGVSLGIAF